MARIVPVCLQNVLCSSVRSLVLIVREIGHRVFTVNEKKKVTWEVQEVDFFCSVCLLFLSLRLVPVCPHLSFSLSLELEINRLRSTPPLPTVTRNGRVIEKARK